MSDTARLTGVWIEVSIDCADLLDSGVDVLSEFSGIGDEVTYYTDVTVKKEVTGDKTLHELSSSIRSLKESLEERKREVLKKINGGENE